MMHVPVRVLFKQEHEHGHGILHTPRRNPSMWSTYEIPPGNFISIPGYRKLLSDPSPMLPAQKV